MVPLKEAIEEKHRQAEQMPFTQWMVRGELTVAEYVTYLFQLYGIFGAIERFPLPHADMSRTVKVLDDIQELNSGSMYYLNLCPSTMQYVRYLYRLTQEELLPHVYLNYMALMFGGQMMKSKIPGAGRIYEFENFRDVVTSIRNVQKDEWADEANVGLDYHIRIYDELQKHTR